MGKKTPALDQKLYVTREGAHSALLRCYSLPHITIGSASSPSCLCQWIFAENSMMKYGPDSCLSSIFHQASLPATCRTIKRSQEYFRSPKDLKLETLRCHYDRNTNRYTVSCETCCNQFAITFLRQSPRAQFSKLTNIAVFQE